MKNDIKVSIIIPVYNGEDYLNQAIDSALEQTYKNIEVIVVNDGSNDSTDEICKSYEDKIKYIKKENGGVSSALNLGIKNMTGTYFSWLSHDDLYEKDKIELQIKKIEELNDEKIILYSNYSVINEKNEFIKNIVLNHEICTVNPYDSIINMNINGITLLIPKDAFKNCGMFDESLRCVQDYELWIKLMKKYKFVHMENIIASSRAHAKQVSNISPNVKKEGTVFYNNLIDKIGISEIEKYYGSKYLFLDNLQMKLRYNSPYIESSDYIKNLKEELILNTNISEKDKLLWIIDDIKKINLSEIIDKIDHNIIKIVLENDVIDSVDNISKINIKDYKFIYRGYDILDFEKLIKILICSNVSIIGDSILNYDNLVHLDKYSKFIHLNLNRTIFVNKNYDAKVNLIKYLFNLLVKSNLIVNEINNDVYSYNSEDLELFMKLFINENPKSSSLASFCYQIAVINNKINSKDGNVCFYEECDKYKNLKYSRMWMLYNKVKDIFRR